MLRKFIILLHPLQKCRKIQTKCCNKQLLFILKLFIDSPELDVTDGPWNDSCSHTFPKRIFVEWLGAKLIIIEFKKAIISKNKRAFCAVGTGTSIYHIICAKICIKIYMREIGCNFFILFLIDYITWCFEHVNIL